MKKSPIAVLALTATLGITPAAINAAQTKDRVSAEQAKLQKEAKISMDQAKGIALKHVKRGKIESSELERENGKLIYSFDIREAGRKDVTEVNVDAIDGTIVAIDHENPKKEAAEKKQEAKETPKH